MKKKFILIFSILIALNVAFSQTESVNQLYEKAKSALFDRKWQQALNELEQIIKKFPESKYYSLAIFYRAKCFEEQNKFSNALKDYSLFLKIIKKSNLIEEAEIAIIDICFILYQKGKKEYLERIISLLSSKNRAVQYYSAFKLSYIKDKKMAVKAVPILKKMMSDESDEELKDRAKIALLRIDPDYIRDLSKRTGYKTDYLFLKIRVYNKKLKKETFVLNIPFALAKLALDALPEKDRRAIERKGYKLDGIIKNLAESGEILRVEDKDDLLKIWIE